MEKNIQTLLFSSLVSLREQRLVGFDKTPEGQKQFDDAAAKIEKSIEDPSKLSPELFAQITDLKVKTIAAGITSGPRVDRLNDLNTLNDKKTELLSKLPEIEKITAADNPEWKQIQKDLTSPEAAVKTKAIDAAVKIIKDAHVAMAEQTQGLNLDSPQDKPLIKIRVKVIAALNKNIENVQATDPENTITFVKPATGGTAAVEALTKLVDHGREFITGNFNTLLQKFNNAATPAAKEIAREDIDKAVLAERKNIYTDMQILTAQDPQYVNAEKQMSELLKQLKQLNDAVASVTPTPTAPTEAAAKVVPGAPVAAPKAPGAKGPDTPAVAEIPTPEADKALSDKGIEAKKVEALTGAKDDAATTKAVEDLNKDLKVEDALKNPADSKVVVDALNKKLEAVGSKKRVEVKEGKLVSKEESVLAKEAASKGALDAKREDSKETKDLKSFFKAILDFIKELAKELGMSPRELLTGVADPSKITAANTPTKGIKAAEEAETKNAEQNKRLAQEAAARAKAAPKGSAASIKAEGEQRQFQEKADRQLRNAQRLEEEADKAVNKDKECDKTARKIQEEAKRRGVQAEVETTPEKRGVVIRPKGGVNPNTLRSFAGEFQQELGANRVSVSGNTFIINYMPNNSGNVQNQINGRDGVQIQGGKTPEAPVQREATPVIKREVVPPTPAPSVKEEATARPIVVKKVKGGSTGNLQ